MSKIKMRCIACGKWFQSANAKEVTCPDCTQKARREKMASKNAPPMTNRPTGPSTLGQSSPTRPSVPPPKPKPAQGGTGHWFDTLDDVKIAQPEQPPARPKFPPTQSQRDNRGGLGSHRGPGDYYEGSNRGPGGYREGMNRGPGGYREGSNRGPGGYREGMNRGPGGYRPVDSGFPGTAFGQRTQRVRQPFEGGPGRSMRTERPARSGPQKPRAKTPRPQTPPKPKREKTPPPPPFVPTAEQVKQVEERYLELALPTEFDGIRTQITKELSIPKKAVKKIIKELRARQSIPSWWELQTYKGSSEELERIKTAYLPLLPVPPVGVHKKIGEELTLKPGVVYQAIKAIRLEMNLPQYNDPILHGIEPSTLSDGEKEQSVEQPISEGNASVANPSDEAKVEPTAIAEVAETKTDGEEA
ncbi:MAG TPA: hypothetical protein VFU49_16175 [Ktedonobacteraceae bacterium]|nr:hypothetical protein [Ktedonobacteraceae bacterium]